jgi:hypothetical protein
MNPKPAPEELSALEAAIRMRNLSPEERERLIFAAGDKVIDLRPRLREQRS